VIVFDDDGGGGGGGDVMIGDSTFSYLGKKFRNIVIKCYFCNDQLIS
jgi:hypothetical protein